jgi:DNA-binding transcriptional ArsR family regulator
VSTLSLHSPSTTDQFVTVFAALSEPIRVRMLQMMVQKGEEDLPCTSLDEELPIAKSTISYHVAILRRAGLIGVRKAGRNYFYQLRHETFETVAPGFLEHLAETEEPILG